ncbi:MAG: hypothetical protein NC935_08095, partial [Candidatus Omnitrophica bacterium]|nr:hypothetical protein [Candidatus Omnitrophota bacterium]
KWHLVKWPRKPSMRDIQKLQPLIEENSSPVGVFGATPEYRFALASFKPACNVFLLDNSYFSYKIMTNILKKDFKIFPKSEFFIPCDWNDIGKVIPQKTFGFLMGDTILPYLQTKEKLSNFLYNCYQILIPGGKFILREFIKGKINYSPKEIRHLPFSPDIKRWCYIFAKNFAVSDNIFYEEKLIKNLLKIGDIKVYKTCADPPRTRLLLNQNDFIQTIYSSGFKIEILEPPSLSPYPTPGLFLLTKR